MRRLADGRAGLDPQDRSMNQTSRSVGATMGVILLGVTAAGAAAFGLFAPVVALGAADLLGGSLGSVARAAMVVIGLISLLFAAAAVVAARMVHMGRPAGVITGFVLGPSSSPDRRSPPPRADGIPPCSPRWGWARASSVRWRSPSRSAARS
jgi:hypothetical protein